MRLQELVLFPDHQLGRGRRRGGPQVGDEIGDGEIGLVADGGDHRDAAAVDGLHHRRLVEGPQVLVAAPAAADDQDVRLFFRRRRR